MTVYKITNRINGKSYIGITNNWKKRLENHKCGKKQVVDQAIRKYGKENFDYDVIFENLSKEEAKEQEKHLIEKYNTKTPNGYNISSGGDYLSGIELELTALHGTSNGRAIFTEEEVRYIKNHRNIPIALLYIECQELFGKKINYETFGKIYHNRTYQDIVPEVEVYDNNKSFGTMIHASSLSFEEIVILRKQYAQIVYWKEAYEPYKDRMRWDSFWQLYNGYGAKGRNIMPEVFTPENKKKHSKLKGMNGSDNPKAKLSEEQVRNIREKYGNGTPYKELYILYPNVSTTTIRDICNRKTWKNI